MLQILLTAAAGILTWTFLEYMLHRYLGHDRRTFPNPFGAEHTRHHSEGNYFAPARKKGIAATIALAIAIAAGTQLVSLDLAAVYGVSLIGMYISYEVVHLRAHTHAGLGAYGRYLRRHHFHHHFVNPRANHGVTTPIWDYVFGTKEVPSQIRVPEKLRMRWLTDETGDVRAEFRDAYALMHARR